MIELTLIILTGLILGSWYAVRTYKLITADTAPDDKTPPSDEVQPELLEKLRTKVAEAQEANPLLKQFNMTVKVDTSAFAAGLQKVGQAMAEIGKTIGNSFERVLVKKQWYFKAPYFDKHDLWVGAYWKTNDIDYLDIDGDELHIYICLLPCVVIHLLRSRVYQMIPKTDKRIDPVCLQCGMPHSQHPMLNMNNLASGKDTCEGRFIK
jgi:hypothetical protein